MKLYFGVIITTLLLVSGMVGCAPEHSQIQEPATSPAPAQTLEPTPKPIAATPLPSESALENKPTLEPEEKEPELPVVEPAPELEPRGPAFTSNRAINQVLYYLDHLSKTTDEAHEYNFEFWIYEEFTAKYYQDKVGTDIEGHKHAGWEVYGKLDESGLEILRHLKEALALKIPLDYKYPKEAWDNCIWAVCRDGYIHEESEGARMVTVDILELTKTSPSSSYYLFPTEPVLIHSITDSVGECPVGYLDIIEFETWRKDSNFTFIINIEDDIRTVKTSYVIEIDCDHNTTGATGAAIDGIDYEVKVDYESNQFCLSEWDSTERRFTRIRDLELFKIEGNKLTITVNLHGIALTCPGFVAVSNLYSDKGGLVMRDMTSPWWYK